MNTRIDLPAKKFFFTKRKTVKACFAFLLSSLLFIGQHETLAVSYKVQPGDTLSTIAYMHLGPPVYGSVGNLKKILQLNSEVKNPDLIYPGQILDFPDDIELEKKNAQTPTREKRKPAATRFPSSQQQSVESSVKQESEAKEQVKVGSWGIEGDYSYLKIKSLDNQTNTSAEVLSKSNVGLLGFWSQDLSARVKSTLHFGARRVELLGASNASFSSKVPYVFKVGADLRWQMISWLGVFGQLAYDQEINLSGVNNQTVGVDLVRIPKLGAGLDVDVLHFSPYVLGLRGTLQMFFPGQAQSYSTKIGYGYYVGSFLLLPLRESAVKASLGLESKSLSAARSDQTETNLLFGVGLSFPVKAYKEDLKKEASSYEY